MISRRSLLSQFGLLAAAGGGAWWLRTAVIWPEPGVAFATGTSSGWLPFTGPGQGMPIVQGRIGATPIEALLDSGAQSSVIDRGLAQRLGLRTLPLGPLILASGLSGPARVGRTAEFDLTLSGLRLSGLRAAVFDLEPVASASGRPFQVIIGQDVLHHLVADIDFPAARLAFAAPDAYAPPAGARAIPVRRRGRELLAPVTVEGSTLDAVLDTGSSGVLSLSPRAAGAAGLFSGRPVEWTPSVTFSGMGQDRMVRVDRVVFAGETYESIEVRIHGGDNPRVPDGLLGVGAFKRFRMIVDVPKARLFLS